MTFVSLFLWLITDVQTSELAVDPRVDHVQVLRDGEVDGDDLGLEIVGAK